MNEIQKTVCALMRSALFGRELCLPEGVDWPGVYKELAVQAVLALPGDLLERLELEPVLRSAWQQAIMQQAYFSFRAAAEQEELVNLMDEQGIPFVILKGTAASLYYAKPEYRQMGDIDFLVPEAFFRKAQEALERHGFRQAGEITEETRDCPYDKGGVLFELHRRFAVDPQEEHGAALEKMLQAGIGRRERQIVLGRAFPMLPSLENGLVLLEHISQHLEGGLGLRQIIDWLMYVRQCLHDDEWPAFRAQAERTGRVQLAMTVTRMGQLYLGLPEERITWCAGAEEGLCADLLEHLFQSGNFGVKDFNSSVAVNALSRSSDGLFRNLQASGCRNWKALKAHPWLRPFAWLYQLCRYAHLGFSREHPIRHLVQDLRRSRKLNRMLRRLGATRHGER